MRLQTFLVSFFVLSGSLSAFAGDSTNTPPWKGQYKIKPHETSRMTPADVLGPDGIAYPNWTKCGVQGGIPDVKAVTSIEKFGGKSDDNIDDSRNGRFRFGVLQFVLVKLLDSRDDLSNVERDPRVAVDDAAQLFRRISRRGTRVRRLATIFVTSGLPGGPWRKSRLSLCSHASWVWRIVGTLRLCWRTSRKSNACCRR